jgi:putative ABC transport system permease protein
VNNVILESVKPAESKGGSTERRWVSSYGLKFRDLRQIRETVPGIARALPVHSYTEQAWVGSRKEEVVVLGVTPGHVEAVKQRVALGRTLTEDDDRERRNVCLVHLQLLRALGWYGDPLGFRMRVGEQVYEVVGVLESEEFRGLTRKALASPGQRENEIYVPYETVLAQRRRTQEVLDKALLAIAGISLLVGGIGIANIMLATVTERTREIGVRRAIGARRIHIIGQFLTETILLAGAGGILGTVLGWASIVKFEDQIDWKARFTPDIALVAVAVSFAVGVLSGLFPAWRASRLDPIQALRHQ